MTNALIGTDHRHYTRLGLEPGVIHHWEDGLRTAAADGTFEWWYFDAHLDDGSTVTVEFHTKPPYLSPKAPLTPFVLLTLTDRTGQRTDRTYLGDPSEFVAAGQDCDVRIGANTFRREAGRYVIHVAVDDVVADFTLTPQVPAWRPETGHVFFGEREEHHIAWLPMCAKGAVDATISIGERTLRASGSGYHDHNWGNIAPRKVLDHWYWGRAQVGDYTVVTLDFVSHDRYDNARLPAVMVAKGGEIVASAVGAEQVAFTGSDVVAHQDTGVPVSRRLQYRVGAGDTRFTITFTHRRDAFTLDLGSAGAYLRFTGDVAVEHATATETVTVAGQTLWELLYFGHRPEAPARAGDAPLIGHQA